MRSFGSTLVAVAALSFSVIAQAADDTSEGILGCGKSQQLRRLFAAGLEPNAQIVRKPALSRAGETDVLNQALDIEIFPGAAAPAPTLAGVNTMTVRCVAPEVSGFDFMLAPALSISQVLFNGSTPLTASGFGSNGRRITFPTPLHAGDVFTLSVAYSGRAVPGQSGISASIVIGTLGAYSLSEPFHAADWWPTKDGDLDEAGDNSDKATVQVSITAPANFVSLSNGVRLGTQTLPSGKIKTQWSTAYPTAPYLVFFASYPYTVSSLTYSYPKPDGSTGTMPVYFAGFAPNSTVINMLTRFRPLFGEYPFINEKYGIYKFGFSGGMEHQTYTGQDTISSSWLNAHELAHQWWGDNVTCRYWNDIWLNEGFASYGECLYAEYSSGRSNRTSYLNAIRAMKPSTTLKSTVYIGGPLTDARIFNYSSSYAKGAWILHMLRGIMGDTTFFDALRAYRAMYEGSAATTADFQAVCETVSGRDLRSFFDHYVYSIEVPTYAVGSRTTPINGKWLLEATIRQAQPESDGLFDLPVEIGVTGQPTRSVRIADRVTRIVSRSTTATPTVTIDPNEWILMNTTISETYINNFPGVIADASPVPGGSIYQNPISSDITLFLSEPPSLTASAFTLKRTENGVAIPLVASYDASTRSLHLRVDGRIPIGEYQLTADIVGSETNLAFDGDVTNPSDPALLPSGNGTPGGTYRLHFLVKPNGCPCDLNADSALTFEDFDVFFQNFEAGTLTGDYNGDGIQTFEDFDAFVADFETGCGIVSPF